MGRLARRFRAVAAPRVGLPAARRPLTVLSALTVAGAAIVGAAAFRSAPPQQARAGQTARQSARLTSARMIPYPIPPAPPRTRNAALTEAGSFGRIILPDLLIVAPAGLSRHQVARLGKITGVQNLIAFDGAQITAGGQSVSVVGVNPATFRSWVPVRTASSQALWTALSQGKFVAAATSAHRLGLKTGQSYQLAGAVSENVGFGGAARLALGGVDLVVNQAQSRKLGLVHEVAALISAPGMSMARLNRAVTKIIGPQGRLESLRSQQLPVSGSAGRGLPTTYLQLFRESAARYCPGLSWTVLAAIGQIESADGTNVGPSSAGAMGPMQFLPSTWARWGIDGFGQTGPPDILNPYDAVPSAARLLCADGAAGGGQQLYHAIFGYNHADWYVREVLGLAARYAAEYPG